MEVWRLGIMPFVDTLRYKKLRGPLKEERKNKN